MDEKGGVGSYERVAKVLSLFLDLSDRELGKLSGTAAATAKKHREALKTDTSELKGERTER